MTAQCCVSVFGGPLNPVVAIGDRVRVRGTVTQFSGLTEISTPDLLVTVLSSGNPVYGPGLVTTGQLGGQRRVVRGLPDPGQLRHHHQRDLAARPARTPTSTINDGTGPVTLRIDRDTNIDGSPAPTGPINIVGVCLPVHAECRPGFTGYQILPRSLADITPCALPGACCFADGSCQTLLEADCVAQGGTFFGGACDPNPCPQPGTGACCFPNGTCQVLTAAACAAQGGIYQGDNIACSPNPCPPPLVPVCDVAADNADGTPVLLNQLVEVEGIAHVTSGTWNTTTQQFELSDGQCCVSVFGGSINPVVNVGDRVRVRGTVIQFQGLTELSNPGLQVTVLSSGNPVFGPGDVTTGQLGLHGRAVRGLPHPGHLRQHHQRNLARGRSERQPDHRRRLRPGDAAHRQGDEHRRHAGPDRPHRHRGRLLPVRGEHAAVPDPPAEPGRHHGRARFRSRGPAASPTAPACSSSRASARRQGGLYQGPATDCDPNPCPQPDGACCFADGACAVLLPEDCQTADGTFFGGPCDPNPCPQPLGACCFPDGTCQYLNQSDCAISRASGWAWAPTAIRIRVRSRSAPAATRTVPAWSRRQAQCSTGAVVPLRRLRSEPVSAAERRVLLPGRRLRGDAAGRLQHRHLARSARTATRTRARSRRRVGACCFVDGTCQVLTEAQCLAGQGDWQGADTRAAIRTRARRRFRWSGRPGAGSRGCTGRRTVSLAHRPS